MTWVFSTMNIDKIRLHNKNEDGFLECSLILYIEIEIAKNIKYKINCI